MSRKPGNSCLHILAEGADSILLASLLPSILEISSAELESNSTRGYSPLGTAIVSGSIEAARILLRYGADPYNSRPKRRAHALHCCALYPSKMAVELAKELLSQDPQCLEARDDEGRTPLHCAAFREHNEMVELLIREGSKLITYDWEGYTPLGAAVSARSIRAVKQICNALRRCHLPHTAW
ncbi:ankyrin, partial [Melanomma pulvis-pyrius CBS 109.77]